jgi:hypothetical protein
MPPQQKLYKLFWVVGWFFCMTLGQSLLGEKFVSVVVGGWWFFKVSFGPKPMVKALELDLDQAEQ